MGKVGQASRAQAAEMTPLLTFTGTDIADLGRKMTNAGLRNMPYSVFGIQNNICAGPVVSVRVDPSLQPKGAAVMAGYVDKNAFTFAARGQLSAAPINSTALGVLAATGIGVLGSKNAEGREIYARFMESVQNQWYGYSGCERVPVLYTPEGRVCVPKEYVQSLIQTAYGMGIYGRTGDMYIPVPPDPAADPRTMTPYNPQVIDNGWETVFASLHTKATNTTALPESNITKINAIIDEIKRQIEARDGVPDDDELIFGYIWVDRNYAYHVDITIIHNPIQITTALVSATDDFNTALAMARMVNINQDFAMPGSVMRLQNYTGEVVVGAYERAPIEYSYYQLERVQDTMVVNEGTVPSTSNPGRVIYSFLPQGPARWTGVACNMGEQRSPIPNGFVALPDATLPRSATPNISSLWPTWDALRLDTTDFAGDTVTSWLPSALWPVDVRNETVEQLQGNGQSWCQDGFPMDFGWELLSFSNSEMISELYDITDTTPLGEGIPRYHWPDDTEPDDLLPTDFASDPGAGEVGAISIYMPARPTMQAFSKWLWTNASVLDALKKLFISPMDGIISLSRVWATPATISTGTIQCGYIDSEIACPIVESTATVDCGTLTIPQYHYSLLDYAPYTTVQLYLPFIGFIQLDTNAVMGRTLAIGYGVSVLDGTCLARVLVDGKLLYTAEGNCAQQLPVSAGSASQTIGKAALSVLGAAIGGGTVQSVAGAAVGRAAGVNIAPIIGGRASGTAGQFGPKQPYAIITRPISENAQNRSRYFGYPAQSTRKLSTCTGFTRVRDPQLDGIPATQEELAEIKQLLENGVII